VAELPAQAFVAVRHPGKRQAAITYAASVANVAAACLKEEWFTATSAHVGKTATLDTRQVIADSS
jgi:hypothetical protein